MAGAVRGYSCSMQGRITNNKSADRTDVEYRQGCPVCEGNNPELECELEEFAELLVDIYISQNEDQLKSRRIVGIDNAH